MVPVSGPREDEMPDAVREYRDFIRDGIKGTVRWERAVWHEQRAIDLADAAIAALVTALEEAKAENLSTIEKAGEIAGALQIRAEAAETTLAVAEDESADRLERLAAAEAALAERRTDAEGDAREQAERVIELEATIERLRDDFAECAGVLYDHCQSCGEPYKKLAERGAGSETQGVRARRNPDGTFVTFEFTEGDHIDCEPQ